jgi:hypothetical protein
MRLCPSVGQLALCGLIALPMVSTSSARGEPPPRAVVGVYGLWDHKPLPDYLVNSPDLAGVSLRAHWDEMEAKEAAFSWLFDAHIAAARQAGKKVMLRVSAGAQTPAWVYQAGAKNFSFRNATQFAPSVGRELQIPIPWDPIFLEKWTAFVAALGKKYGNDETVVLVHIAGPTKSSSEMHLPKTEVDKKNWDKAGYTKDKLVGAWKTVINAYADAFPDKPLALNVAVPLHDDGVVTEVLAYASRKLGRRLCVQHNALSDHTNQRFKPQRWVGSCRDKATLGYQLLCPVTPRGKFNDDGRRFGGPLKPAFQLGLQSGGSYFEIYPIDLTNEAASRDIRDLARQLRQ